MLEKAFVLLNVLEEMEDDEDLYNERDPNMPPLGSRVRRGRDWQWGNQDRFGPGPDWNWHDQDGGVEPVDSVLSVRANGVLVRWQNILSNRHLYRFGHHGRFEVQLCDPFSPKSVLFHKDQMRRAALHYPEEHVSGATKDDDRLSAGYSAVESVKTLSSADPETKPVLHINKGKYFKNDNSSADIETNGPSSLRSMNRWFWKDDKGDWNPFRSEMNDRVNKYYKRDPKSTVVVTIQDQ